MRAAQLYGVRDLRVEELDDPVVDDGNVLIDISACGVCPSDVRWYTGGREGGEYPRRLGHEWVGRVLDVAPGVGGFAEGDRVAIRWTATATHTGELMGIPATGKSVSMNGIMIDRWVNGKVAEHWEQLDMMGLMQQLGVAG